MSKNYLILGNDEYIKKTELDRIKNSLFSARDQDLNYSVYKTDEVSEIMDSLGTMPFLSDARLIVVEKAEDLTDRDAETFENYLKNPSETNVLVMLAAASFSKKKFYKKISTHMEIKRADKPDVNTIRKWIYTFFKKENVQIEAEAVEAIIDLKGDDTASIKIELDKLLSFSGGEKIELKHIKDLVGKSVYDTVFSLIDAINQKNSKWAFQVIADLYEQKKHSTEILGYLAWYIRIMQKIVFCKKQGTSDIGISQELGYSPGYTNRLINQAREYPPKKIKKWVTLILETDTGIKTGKIEAGLGVEMLVATLMK